MQGEAKAERLGIAAEEADWEVLTPAHLHSQAHGATPAPKCLLLWKALGDTGAGTIATLVP
jgi:hypothetical protein